MAYLIYKNKLTIGKFLLKKRLSVLLHNIDNSKLAVFFLKISCSIGMSIKTNAP